MRKSLSRSVGLVVSNRLEMLCKGVHRSESWSVRSRNGDSSEKNLNLQEEADSDIPAPEHPKHFRASMHRALELMEAFARVERFK